MHHPLAQCGHGAIGAGQNGHGAAALRQGLRRRHGKLRQQNHIASGQGGHGRSNFLVMQIGLSPV